ncbi:MAG: hypothetical protein U5R06_16855 [candidate division KSB1 bacterium]|nr:hypothetical protein [candidate division KSB1 bacterium]
MYISSMGLRIVARTYGFSHEDYQDFALTHYMFINTGEANEVEDGFTGSGFNRPLLDTGPLEIMA